MSEYIKHFSEISRNDVGEVGGKGANLGDLARNGFPVPPGFVVTAEAYKRFFQQHNLNKELRDLTNIPPNELENRCSAIRNTIKNAELPQDLADAILTAHENLINPRDSQTLCAVRSSATAEDLSEASFAGQHGTYYYVEKLRLLQMIKHCWASLWNQEAVCYRSTRRINHVSVFMAVVVQEMIESEISGITFTANPVTGSQAEIVIESSWGMGAAIVDGRVTPDRYILARNGLKPREKRIAEKRFMVLPHLKDVGKTRLQDVPHAMRRQETLSADLVKMVAEWAVKSEEHFGTPQDVEWAINDGQFYMLQSRPITVMGREEIGQAVKGQYVLAKPFVENFTEPLTPLTTELLEHNVFTLTGARFIRGWPYINLKSFRLFLPFKISDEDLVNLVYLSFATPPKMKLSLPKLPFSLLLLFYLYLVSGVSWARTRGMPDDFMDGFRELCRKVEDDPSFGPFETMQRLWSLPHFFEPIGNMPLWVNLSSVRYINLLDVLTKLVRRWAPDVRDDAEALLCSGSEGVLSAEMGRDILTLAMEATHHDQVKKLFLEHTPEKLLPKLRVEPEAKEFITQLDRFLTKNGHRGLKELELQSVRWEENPAPVLGMIRNYLLIETDLTDHEEKTAQTRKAIETELRGKLEKYPLERTFRLRWRLIHYLAGQIRSFAKLRENSRFYHIMAFYMVRKKILKIEAEFLRQGKLKCKDDIFFMKLGEIGRMQAGQLGWFDVEDRIRKRRIEHLRLSKTKPPKTIGIKIKETLQAEDLTDEGGIALWGQSASPGNYEGIARVILDPSIDTELKTGEILVAPYTDPAWTPLFLTAGAAVVEVGSYLSHAGTVAREYGMPCVVDVADCTKRIQTGDRIRVDGECGIVRVLINN